MFKKIALTLCGAGLSAVLLTGCTTTPEQCDPSQDQGFFGKIGCTVSGSYDERITQREQRVEALKAENQRLNQLARDLFAQDALVKAQLSEQNRMLDHAKSELYAVQASLAQKKALSSDLQEQIAQAQQQIDELKKANTSSQTKAALAQKQKQIDELNATLEQLQSQLI